MEQKDKAPKGKAQKGKVSKDRIQKNRTKNNNSQNSKNDNSDSSGAGSLQLEDKILKTAAQFFGDSLLPFMGIEGVIRYVAPTEQIHLEARRLEEDFNFAMEDGTLRHLYLRCEDVKGFSDRGAEHLPRRGHPPKGSRCRCIVPAG